VHEIELLFEDAIGSLLGKGLSNHINELMRGHLGIFNHLEETSPDQSSAQDIVD
jgi:hypothetical protein